jgi:hypothetical protein
MVVGTTVGGAVSMHRRITDSKDVCCDALSGFSVAPATAAAYLHPARRAFLAEVRVFGKPRLQRIVIKRHLKLGEIALLPWLDGGAASQAANQCDEQ